MMKNAMMIIISVFYLPLAGKAQINLVLNPNFEIYTTCPDNDDEAKYCNHWMSIDSAWNPPDWAHEKPGIPEYCNVCAAPGETSVPANARFTHSPHSGNGMMQVQMFTDDSTSPNTRDYLQGHLAQTLTAGHKYNVRFYTTLEQSGGFAVNGIGAYLDDGTIDTTQNPGHVQNQYTPQIVDTSIINTNNWVKVEDTFTANGTEKLITIGQFRYVYRTNYVIVTTGIYTSWAWYLIDDVSVIDCSNVPFAGHDTVIHLADSAFLGSHETLLPYTWYKLGSTTPIDSSGGIWVKPTVTTSYVLVQKLCGVTKMDTVKVWVYPDTPNHVAVEQLLTGNFQLYPNPTTKELTIEGAKDLDVVFYDVVGRAVLQSAITTDKATFDISPLAKGLYMVQVVDRSTGERIVRQVLKE
jgi:hypothetical protein